MDIVTPGEAIHPGNLESIAKERSQAQSKGASVARFGAIEAGFLAVFAAIVAIAIAHHEPWGDEAQAWQISRSLPLHDLFATYLHYELHPGLWFVFLRALILTGVSYSAMHWICGGIGVASTWFLLRYSPFPRYLKIIFPFTFFLLFQYVVVARAYVLAPILFYLVAWSWRKNPLLLALLLGLMANVELHLAVVSVGLAIVYCFEKFRSRTNIEAAETRRLLFAAILFAGLVSFALWTAWPAADFSNWHRRNNSLVLTPLFSLFMGTCDPWWLGPVFWFAVVMCFYERRALYYLIPVLCLAEFSGISNVSFWHEGLVNPLLISILWITWPCPSADKGRFERLCRIALVVVFATQTLWTAHAVAYDYRNNYSGDAAAAKFLAPYVRGKATIAVTYAGNDDASGLAVGILPYFLEPIFANWPKNFWWESTRNRSGQNLDALLRDHPDVIIAETYFPGSQYNLDLSTSRIKSLVNSDYRITNLFCGSQPERRSFYLTTCHIILRNSKSVRFNGDHAVPRTSE